jgi:hypothetical protein
MMNYRVERILRALWWVFVGFIFGTIFWDAMAMSVKMGIYRAVQP